MADKSPENKLDSFALICWGALLISPIMLMVEYCMQLWQLDQYQYFPVLVLAVGMLFFSRWSRTVHLPAAWHSWGLLAVGIVSTVLASLYWSPWLGCAGFLFLFGAFLSCCEGDPKSYWGMLSLWPASWMLLRLPLNLDYQLTNWLQLNTATISSHILDRIDLPHRLTGSVFYLAKGPLFVEAACSGVQSLFSVLFCAFLLVVWLHRSPVLLPLYAVAGVLWAGIMNIFRVTSIAIAQEWWQVDLSHGWQHEVLGYCCLFTAIIMLLSTDRFLRVVFYPVPTDGSLDRQVNPLLNVWNYLLASMATEGRQDESQHGLVPRRSDNRKLVSRVVIASVCLMLIPEIVFGYSAWSHKSEVRRVGIWQASADLLTNKVPGLEVLEHSESSDSSNPALGQSSHMWVVRSNGVVSRIVVSQHSEVHDLCTCYGANGWQLKNREVLDDADLVDAEKWDCINAQFVNSETVFGYLMFSTLDSAARSVRLRKRTLSEYFLSRVDRGDQPWQFGFDGDTTNIQLWTTSDIPLEAAQIESLKLLHQQVRQVIRNDLASVKLN